MENGLCAPGCYSNFEDKMKEQYFITLDMMKEAPKGSEKMYYCIEMIKLYNECECD